MLMKFNTRRISGTRLLQLREQIWFF